MGDDTPRSSLEWDARKAGQLVFGLEERSLHGRGAEAKMWYGGQGTPELNTAYFAITSYMRRNS